MRSRRLFVHSNPYAHIDANGRLAGATPIGEHPRPTTSPARRRFVGAERMLLEHDTKGRGPGAAQLPRSEYEWRFSAGPVEVDSSGQLAGYYAQRIAAGELFACKSADDVPRAELAKARAAALAQFKAENLADADTTGWAEQFPTDAAFQPKAPKKESDR